MNKAVLLILAFFIIGGYIIKTGMDLQLDDSEDRQVFAKELVKWIWGVGKNTKDVVGYAIKEHDWLPKTETVNETNSTG